MFDGAKAFSSFAVDDTAAAKRFYGETLGLRVSEEGGALMLPYPSVRIRVGCWQDPDALVGWGWLSCWLPVMACDAAPPAPPLFLDR